MCDEIIREIIQTATGNIDLDDEQSIFPMGFDGDLHWQIISEIEESLSIIMDDDSCDEAESVIDFINIAKESPSNIVH
jgi:hypothetical protein